MKEILAAESTQILAYLAVAMIPFSALIGAIAAISPRFFEKLVRIGDKGISLDRVVAIIERPIDVEGNLKPHTRLLGLSALISAICVGLQLYPMV